MAERSQSRGLPWPRSTTGLGMSGYRDWYTLTEVRCARPSNSATPCASIKSSVSTFGDITTSLHLLTPDDKNLYTGVDICSGPGGAGTPPDPATT